MPQSNLHRIQWRLQSGFCWDGLATTTPDAAPGTRSPSGPIFAKTPFKEIIISEEMKDSRSYALFVRDPSVVADVGVADKAAITATKGNGVMYILLTRTP
jgi:hypothetical protein